VFVRGAEEVTTELLSTFPGTRVAVKVISPQILHKSDVGGVAIVDRSVERVAATIGDMHARSARRAWSDTPSASSSATPLRWATNSSSACAGPRMSGPW